MANLDALGWMSGAGTLISMWGNLESGKMAEIQGRRAKQAADFAATQMEARAGQALAASQMAALEVRRKAQLMESRALAVAAAGGGGVSDTTIVKLISDLAGEGSYRAAVELYEGQDRARQLKMQAGLERITGAGEALAGEMRKTAYGLKAFESGVTGALSLYSRYGGGGPDKNASGDAALIEQFSP